MATASKQAAAKEGKGGKGSKGKLILIILVALLVLGGAGGGAAWWFLLRPKAKPSPQQLAEQQAKNSHFISLEPFVTNVLSTDGQTHYVQVTVDLKTDQAEADAQVKALMPEIRSSVLNILAAQQASAVATESVRNQLRASILDDVNKILGGGQTTKAAKAAKGPITGVYFSGFVMQ